MRFRRNSGVEADIPNSSMSDIAFLLLVFFMVTTAFAARKGIDFRLPKDSDQDDNKPDDIEVKSVIIEIRSSGRLLVNANPMNLSDIRPFLGPILAADPKKFVIIKVNDDATYGDMMDVMDELKQAEVQNIALPSKEEMKSWL